MRGFKKIVVRIGGVESVQDVPAEWFSGPGPVQMAFPMVVAGEKVILSVVVNDSEAEPAADEIPPWEPPFDPPYAGKVAG